MAYFTQLNINNKVIHVLSVEEKYMLNSEGVEEESVGSEYCKKTYNSETEWKQTFTDGTRVHFASVGYSYDAQKDAFIPPKPFDSWILDNDSLTWQSPIGAPPKISDEEHSIGCFYIWDEDAYQSNNTVGWIIKNPSIE